MSNNTSFSDIISRDFMEFIHNSSQSPQSLFNEINYALQFVSNVIIDTGGTIPQPLLKLDEAFGVMLHMTPAQHVTPIPISAHSSIEHKVERPVLVGHYH